ncbi:MAG: hypothetical protein GEV10_29670 [Streptosporangiales bacterium]|nr:hypothetical protein [Streptosporangiales bacterium]
MSARPASRTEFLAETARLLWPSPGAVTTGRAGANGSHAAGSRVVSEFLALPDLAHARLLLPLRARRAAAAVAHRYAEPWSPVRRMRARAMSLALASGAAELLLRDRVTVAAPAGANDTFDSIETLLAGVVGRPVAVGLYVTRPRANRKPLLQVLTEDGVLVAFTKVGVDDFTRTLVTNEAQAVRMVGREPRRSFTVPDVLDLRTWHGLEVLTLSALPVHERRATLDPGRLAVVAAEIAATAGIELAVPAWSAYVQRLRDRLGMLPAGAGHRLATAVDGILDAHGTAPLPFAAWHGDLTPWNMATLRDTVLVWDWERYETGVPLGFDLVHHHVQQHLLAPGADVGALVRQLPRRTSAALGSVGLDLREATTCAALYLVDIAARYVHDRQDEVGAMATVLPAMLDAIGDLGAAVRE